MNGREFNPSGRGGERMDEFRRALLEAVDEGLLVLGDSVRQVIYRHMESSLSIKRDEIPERLEDFSEVLKKMLGSGANILLTFIARKLYAKFELSFEERSGWGFIDYVENAKRNVEAV